MSSASYRNMCAHTDTQLNVLSMFVTVDGEANYFHQGTWSIFLRLTGCRVGCNWCDTKYSWGLRQGKLMTPEEIIDSIRNLQRDQKATSVQKVTITGGEPMEQDGNAFRGLLLALYHCNFDVSLETAGTHDVRYLMAIHPRLKLVLDVKPPSARALVPTFWENYWYLSSDHTVKIIIDSRADFYWAITTTRQLREKWNCHARIVFSPSHGSVSPDMLMEWMREVGAADAGVSGINLQLHKYLFPENVRAEEVPLTHQ